MLGCYEILISHTVKTTLLLFHIIKLHFFFGGGVWHFFGPYKYKYKVEKETKHDLSPMLVGMLGREELHRAYRVGIGKSSC